jgi:hypothetical protein
MVAQIFVSMSMNPVLQPITGSCHCQVLFINVQIVTTADLCLCSRNTEEVKITTNNEIGVHERCRICLLKKLTWWSWIPVSRRIAQFFDIFRTFVWNLKVHCHVHSSSLLDPLLNHLYRAPSLKIKFKDKAQITTTLKMVYKIPQQLLLYWILPL